MHSHPVPGRYPRLAALVAATPYSSAACAHVEAGVWPIDPFGAALLALLAAAYAIGHWRLNSRSVVRGQRRARALWFWTGWGALGVALGPPLEALTAVSFAAHMTQHELMMLVAAPLLVLARPLGTLLWGLPRSCSSIVKARGVRAAAGRMSAPLAAWLLHALVLWGWHLPVAFEAGLRSEPVHWLQHLSFFAAAVIFWWSVLVGGRSAEHRGIALLSVFTTAIHTTVLGMLLTFSTRLWYPTYAAAASPWGLSAIEDQQLGGLVMWVPGGMVFAAAGLALAAAWLKGAELSRSAR